MKVYNNQKKKQLYNSPAGDQLWNSGRQNWIFGRIGDQEGAISDPDQSLFIHEWVTMSHLQPRPLVYIYNKKSFLWLSFSMKYLLLFQFNPKWLFCFLLIFSDMPTVPIIDPVPAPQFVGEDAAAMKSPSQSILSNFSFTNLKTEIKNIR